MPFNGSGTFTLVAGNPVVTGTVISSTVQNNTTSDFATGFTNCVTRDGQSAALSNLPMGGYKHTGATSASTTGEYLVYGQTAASLSSATVGTLPVTGNANINGNVTIGDAASDTLTVNPNAVTWAGTPVAHTGQHGFAGGVTVGNSAVAGVTVLDYYLEGTWTVGVTSSGGTPSLGTSYGNYTRVGNRVFFDFFLNVTGFGTSTGAISITGLPFNSAASAETSVFCAFAGSDASPVPNGIISAGASTIALKRSTGANYTPSLTSGSLAISGYGHYKV